jgi:hypothetical protein
MRYPQTQLLVQQPNAFFCHKLVLVPIVGFFVDYTSQEHTFKENLYWTSISVEQFAQLQNIIKPFYLLNLAALNGENTSFLV